jgi:hypothetical protein
MLRPYCAVTSQTVSQKRTEMSLHKVVAAAPITAQQNYKGLA